MIMENNLIFFFKLLFWQGYSYHKTLDFPFSASKATLIFILRKWYLYLYIQNSRIVIVFGDFGPTFLNTIDCIFNPPRCYKDFEKVKLNTVPFKCLWHLWCRPEIWSHYVSSPVAGVQCRLYLIKGEWKYISRGETIPSMFQQYNKSDYFNCLLWYIC